MAGKLNDTVRLTVGQAIVKYLQVQFSERDENKRRLVHAAFGIFGHGNVHGLGQALREYGTDLPFYQPRNEQSMVHTAIGFAKANQRLATIACTSSIGPGATNMLTGAATATINRVPVLLFPSDYYVTRHQGPVLQQLEHSISADISVNDAFRPLSRFFDRISRPEQILTALPEACRVLTDPAETGAVTIALPQDIQAHSYDYPTHFFEERTWRVERRLPDPQRISEAAVMLKNARNPVIIAGGGIHYSQAWDELQTFSEKFGIPVVETFGGKGAFRNESPLLVGAHTITGPTSAAKIVSEADLVIAVGTRLTDVVTGAQSGFRNPDVKFVGINVTSHDAFKQGALPIIADAREALRSLIDASVSVGIGPNLEHLENVASAKNEWEKQLRSEVYNDIPGEPMGQGQLIQTLNDSAQTGDTIVAAAGTPPGNLVNLWDATDGRKCHLEFGNSCMGYEIPGSIGVRMAQPNGEVYVLIGDGTYLLSPSEIMTAVQEGLKITVVISENHGFQSIRQLQMARAGRAFATEFRNRDESTGRLDGDYVAVDLAKTAEGLGAHVWKASTPEEVRIAMSEAREETGTCVIVAETHPDRYVPPSNVWFDVEAAEVSNDPETQALRTVYEEERKHQRFHY
jgi:3D-(3,5/4)-trihydroxycyclohexane-1,2-dione acylhydrolase (decyclizing)